MFIVLPNESIGISAPKDLALNPGNLLISFKKN